MCGYHVVHDQGRARRRLYGMVEAEELYEFVGGKEIGSERLKIKRKGNNKKQSKIKIRHSSQGRLRK